MTNAEDSSAAAAAAKIDGASSWTGKYEKPSFFKCGAVSV